MPIFAPGQGTGFTSISDYLNANQGTVANERGALAGDVGGQLDATRTADDAVIGQVQPQQARTPLVFDLKAPGPAPTAPFHIDHPLFDSINQALQRKYEQDKARYGEEVAAYKHQKDTFDAEQQANSQPTKSDYTTTPGYSEALAKQGAALESATNLKTHGGISTLLKQHYGTDPAYTEDKSNFDASLVGTGGFEDVQNKAQSLTDYLNKGGSAAANVVLPPPPTPEPTPTPEPEPPEFEDYARFPGPGGRYTPPNHGPRNTPPSYSRPPPQPDPSDPENRRRNPRTGAVQ